SLATLADLKLPSGVKFEGEDLSASFLGKKQQERSKPIFWNRPPDRPGPTDDPWPDISMREGDWKLLLMEDGNHPQLYNLAKDPNETYNLAREQPKLVERLRKKLLAWRNSLPAPKL